MDETENSLKDPGESDRRIRMDGNVEVVYIPDKFNRDGGRSPFGRAGMEAVG